jgi:PERQ amino acid-rich with GYF domain-containing protein
MKEIQEEEETRKRLLAKETSSLAVPKRAYAETTTRPATMPIASLNNNAWTTVGPSGKTSAVLASTLRPSAQTSSGSGTSAAPRVSISPIQKVTPAPTFKPRPSANKADDLNEAPSHDFLKWLSDALKGLNNSVNVEEIVSMLLSFPLDPDASTTEIISDTIYSNSTTLDGRRFASEFVAKRKADAHAKSKGASILGKAPAKQVSIADVVKAAPKAVQPEWGFKVVNKKKRGGRL